MFDLTFRPSNKLVNAITHERQTQFMNPSFQDCNAMYKTTALYEDIGLLCNISPTNISCKSHFPTYLP